MAQREPGRRLARPQQQLATATWTRHILELLPPRLGRSSPVPACPNTPRPRRVRQPRRLLLYPNTHTACACSPCWMQVLMGPSTSGARQEYRGVTLYNIFLIVTKYVKNLEVVRDYGITSEMGKRRSNLYILWRRSNYIEKHMRFAQTWMWEKQLIYFPFVTCSDETVFLITKNFFSIFFLFFLTFPFPS